MKEKEKITLITNRTKLEGRCECWRKIENSIIKLKLKTYKIIRRQAHRISLMDWTSKIQEKKMV